MSRRAGRVLAALSIAAIAFVGVIMGGLGAGYRPVVILTGSMGEYAPPGSLVIARPVTGTEVAVGDVLVMRRPGAAPVTHRVIEIEAADGVPFAVTHGDANEAPDAVPYPLGTDELVSRWVIPGLGRWMLTVFQPGIALAVVAVATVVIAIRTLKRIWFPSSASRPAAPVPTPPVHPGARASAGAPATGRPRRRRGGKRAVLIASSPLVGLLSAGVAWAMFTGTESVSSNSFTTAECFDPQLGSVQNGVTTHTVDGTVTESITAVEPTEAFVLASARSSSNRIADGSVQVTLAGDGTSLHLDRATTDPTPDPIEVAWSVVEYSCGVTVQRGTVSGDGTDSVDVSIADVDPAASFVLLTSQAPSGADNPNPGDLVAPTVSATDTVTLSAAPGQPIDAARTFAWQVVTFDDPADVEVQTVTGTIAGGATTASLTSASPADPATTFLLASPTSAATGVAIGDRFVRAELVDPSTVAVTRSVASATPVQVSVQIVTLRDGSSVQRGLANLAPGNNTATSTLDPVDPTRSVAVSTVAVPGPMAGGSTDQTADDVLGEGSATFEVTDPTTLVTTRAATTSTASFGWQVIEWAGPTWWDPSYQFRQRLDVSAGAAAVPGGYTVPVTLDHAALVSVNMARADGADARIMRWDGTTWTELDRILADGSSWNSTTTQLLFRTTDPVAADSASVYWLYLGNDTPSAPPEDPNQVFLLNEDFESGTLGAFEDRTTGSGWYGADPWTRRIPVTISAAAVPSTLTDFPVLVSVTDADLAASAQADGSDIRFTAADGSTLLSHEVERWDAGSGTLEAWVEVPTVDATTDTTFSLVYGAADAPAKADPDGVWSNGYQAVWHLARDPGGPAPAFDDATANNHDGTATGGLGAGNLITGTSGHAIDFDGVDDHAQLGLVPTAVGGRVTYQAWVRADTVAATGTVFSVDDGATTSLALAVDPLGPGTGTARARLLVDGSPIDATAGPVNVGTWHHLAAVHDGSTLTLYLDGVPGTPVAADGTTTANLSATTSIGATTTGADRFDGAIDEVRLSNTARSADHLAVQVANVTGSLVSTGTPTGGTWLTQGAWSYRRGVTVSPDLVDGATTDAHVLVRITDTDLGVQSRADGADLVFTGADGTTRLDHVIERWIPGTGTLSAWVRVPSVDPGTGADLFLYYGNSSAQDQQDPHAVFGPDADLVSLGG